MKLIFFINLEIDQNLTESDIKIIDVKSQIEHQIQIQETKDSGWIFDKINSMRKKLSKTGDSNGPSYVKIHLRSNAMLKIEKKTKNLVSFGQF